MKNARFIDKYQLLSTAPDAEDPVLVLWDFSDPMTHTKLVLELEKLISERQESIIMRQHESQKTLLPFREDPGAGIIVLSLTGAETGERTFVVPVKALAGFKNGRSPGLPQEHEITVKWDDWKHFVVPIEPPAELRSASHKPFIFHSQLVYLRETSRGLFLHVYEFSESLYSRMAKEKGRQSSDAPSRPPYVSYRVGLPVHPSDDSTIYVVPEGCVFLDKVRIPW